MKQVRILKIAVLVLVLLNLAFLAFHFTRTRKHRPMHAGPNGIAKMISRELNFNKEQTIEFEDLIVIHKANIDRLVKEKTQVKRKLYKLLDGKNEHVKGQPALIAELGGIQVELEALHYEHFNRIRQLCTEDQVDGFKKLQRKLVHIFSRKPPMELEQ